MKPKGSAAAQITENDRQIVRYFAMEQLYHDAQGRQLTEQDDFFGFRPKKIRRCRAAAKYMIACKNGDDDAVEGHDQATIMPIGLKAMQKPAAKVKLGAGIFRPVPFKASSEANDAAPSGSGGRMTRASRLQSTQPPNRIEKPKPIKEENGRKRRLSLPRVVPPRFWAPSFRGHGSLTGIPLDVNSGVKPMFPSQPPAQFVQPDWPDPTMLRKLAKGSAADLTQAPKAGAQPSSQLPFSPASIGEEAFVELVNALHGKVTRMGCMLETLNARVSTLQDVMTSVPTQTIPVAEPTLVPFASYNMS